MAEPAFLRPADSIGGGLQHERTGLAWERTAISMMVAGVLLARYATEDAHFILGSAGIAETVGGGVLLLWAGRNDRMLHDPASPPEVVPQVRVARVVGLGTVAFTGVALILAIVLTLSNQ